MSLINALERLETALDSYNADGVASSIALLTELLGSQSAIAVAKAMLNQHERYNLRQGKRLRQAMLA